MASITLAEAGKLYHNPLVAGLAETIVTVDRTFDVLPFTEVAGDALIVKQEATLGDAQALAIDGTITAKSAATFNRVTFPFVTLIGDAETDGRIIDTAPGPDEPRSVQIASKAKSLGRHFRSQFINGTGLSETFEGLLVKVAGAQTIEAGANGAALTLAMLDALIDVPTAKDGDVDFFIMHAEVQRVYFALLRALGGASIEASVTLPSGRTVPAYRGIPIFRNDWVPRGQTQGTSSTCTTVFAGCWDDGSNKVGVFAMRPPGESMGLGVKEVGWAEGKNNMIDRLTWYTGLGLGSPLGLAALVGVTTAAGGAAPTP